MTIDIHTHLGRDRMSIEYVAHKEMPSLVETMLHQMDAHGIDKAVISPFEPNVTTDLCIEAAAIDPDRLLCACSLAPRPIDVAKKQLRSYVEQGCIGVVLDEKAYYPADPAAQSLVNDAVREGIAVFIHSYNVSQEDISFIDTVSTVHSDARFVICHSGGLFGFSRLLPFAARENVWFDVSSTLIRLVESPLRVFLDALAQDQGVLRLAFGSEHFTEYGDLRAALNLLDLNVETMRMILSDNARRILGMS